MIIQKLKILFLFSSLKKKEFFYSFKQRDFWIRVASVIAVAYLVVNSISSSSFLVQFVKSNFNSGSINYVPIFNIILSIVFLGNIVSIIFLGTTNYKQSFLKTFLRYPITIKQIIFFRTVSVSSEIVNIIFLPIYISAYFVAGNTFNITGLLIFFLILLLFLFCFNSLIELLRNITSAIISLKKFKLLFWSLTFIILIFFLWLIPIIPSYFTNEESVNKVSDILFYFPTGVFTKTIFALTGNINVSQLFVNIFYLILFSAILFIANLLLVKFYKNRDFGKVLNRLRLSRPKISSLLYKTSLGPFETKNIIYLFRSPRTLFNCIGIIIYGILFAYFITVKLYGGTIKDIYAALSVIILFQSLIILVNGANFFAFDYSGIINYFFRPLKIKSLIKSKVLVTNILMIINIFCFIYLVLLLKLNVIDIILQIDFLILGYFVIMFITILLSFFLPKVVGFYSIMGMNYPFLSFIISTILAISFWGLDYLLLAEIKSVHAKLVIIFLVFLINLTIIYSKEKLFGLFNKILINQKEKIIDVCL